jgi:D-hydantoinase
MEKVDLVIKNGKVVTSTGVVSAGIAIDKEKIVAIAKETSLPPASKTIDAGGKYVLPGLIDGHVHYGYGHARTVDVFQKFLPDDSQSSAAGGVTTYGHYIRREGPGIRELFEEHRKVADKYSYIDGFFHLVASAEILDEIPEAVELGINSIKFLIGYKGVKLPNVVMLPVDDGVTYDGFERIGKLAKEGRNVWAMTHCEDIEIITMLQKRLRAAGRKDAQTWADSRPNFCEAEQIRRCIYFAQLTGCPLYIVHNTIGEAPELIARAKADGIKVVGETCPQYLVLKNEDLPAIFKEWPTLAVVNPPIRHQWDIDKMWEGIRDGWIETIGSDYAPQTLASKGKDLWESKQPGLGACSELILPTLLDGVNKGRISLEKAVEISSYNPAKIFGLLPEKGQIAVGSDADLLIVDMNKKMEVSARVLHTPPEIADWTMYDGLEFQGWPVMTILRGKVIVEDGKVLGKPGDGRWYPGKSK